MWPLVAGLVKIKVKMWPVFKIQDTLCSLTPFLLFYSLYCNISGFKDTSKQFPTHYESVDQSDSASSMERAHTQCWHICTDSSQQHWRGRWSCRFRWYAFVWPFYISDLCFMLKKLENIRDCFDNQFYLEKMGKCLEYS